MIYGEQEWNQATTADHCCSAEGTCHPWHISHFQSQMGEELIPSHIYLDSVVVLVVVCMGIRGLRATIMAATF